MFSSGISRTKSVSRKEVVMADHAGLCRNIKQHVRIFCGFSRVADCRFATNCKILALLRTERTRIGTEKEEQGRHRWSREPFHGHSFWSSGSLRREAGGSLL